eukprot:scaffold7709_cov62-Phaeocystis_antarctica.AAC.9
MLIGGATPGGATPAPASKARWPLAEVERQRWERSSLSQGAGASASAPALALAPASASASASASAPAREGCGRGSGGTVCSLLGGVDGAQFTVDGGDALRTAELRGLGMDRRRGAAQVGIERRELPRQIHLGWMDRWIDG